MALDAKFHNEIVRATGNSVLAEVIRMLHQRASRIWHLQVWSDADLRLDADRARGDLSRP